jgi:Response regulator receiver domain
MPHTNGIEATRLIHQDYPAVGVIILTAHKEAETTLEALKEAETTFEALKAGAMGCLPKSARLDEIRSAVKAVADGGAVFDAVQAVNLMDQFNSWGAVQAGSLRPSHRQRVHHLGGPFGRHDRGPNCQQAPDLPAHGQRPPGQHLPQAPRQQLGRRGEVRSVANHRQTANPQRNRSGGISRQPVHGACPGREPEGPGRQCWPAVAGVWPDGWAAPAHGPELTSRAAHRSRTAGDCASAPRSPSWRSPARMTVPRSWTRAPRPG